LASVSAWSWPRPAHEQSHALTYNQETRHLPVMNGIEQQKAYWQRQLSELPPLPELPWDKERPPVSSFVRDTITIKLGAEIWAGIKHLTARSDATPQVGLLAGLKTLLFRYTGQTDLVIGTLLTAYSSPARQQFVALRTRFDSHWEVQDLVLQIAASVREARDHLDVPLDKVMELLGRRPGVQETGLFNVALILSEPQERAADAAHTRQSIPADHLMTCALVFRASETREGLSLSCEFDAELFEPATVERLVGHLNNLLAGIAAQPHARLDRLKLLSPAELRQLITEWNSTETTVPKSASIHQLIEAQAQATPEAVAVVCRNRQMTYAELNARANQVASCLAKHGVGPDVLVGICLDRSFDMLVGLLGILKSGGAYVPLDPAYPLERLAFMIEDARVRVVLTQEHLVAALPAGDAPRVRLDADWTVIGAEPKENVDRGVAPHHLAYVIYTSGSTGKPKGVMVEHRNVINFFAGMDARIQHEPGSTWLALTSPSFDISVLELFWTLARGFKIVLFAGDEAKRPSVATSHEASPRPIDFSLFYFSSDQNNGPGGAYRLLTEGARFADEHGFVAVWTPERHFHEFGGLFPNPSVTSAALAMITKRVQIRSGSVVAPLHSPIRIAEEWSVVDNLSNGRVAISFASGWMPEDFAVNPASYANRKEIMVQHLETVRRLWRGERVPVPGPLGKDVPIRIFPNPVQRELPLWLTAAGNPETFELAGKLGTNLLTHLLGQSIEEVNRKIGLYRQAWRDAGHPGRGHVTLMLHTFVGKSLESVKATVRQPLIEYLRKSADLIKNYAWAFSAFKHSSKSKAQVDFSALPKDEMDAMLEHAFDRYFETSGLFGTPESCLETIAKLRANDIDEAACLIDFGVDPDLVLENLKYLDLLRQAVSQGAPDESADYSIPTLIQRHDVTHLQCTPSMAGMLLLDQRTQQAFGRLRCLLIGGEAFPAALARQLGKITNGKIINMYGPTETTIWSSTCEVSSEPVRVPVGRPIANTQIYVLDHNQLPVPVGIAGEVMIGGAGVARGYLGRPELTAERFIANPFTGNGTGRLYRTGDVGRFLPDGNIELLGRIDLQVKIRGHRVELGEIEALLNQHPAVRESVVIAREAAGGDKQLVAYVIARPGQEPTRQQLRQYAKERMPDHMVPAQVVFLNAFPQTPNRKIDRKALPAPESDPAEIQSDFNPPATELEQAVAALWSELLGISRVGRNDNFFEAGGHSLLAMQLVAQVRGRFGVDLPLRNLFEHPTVAGLADAIEALSWSTLAKAPVQTSGVREEVEV
jgi:natural product biosynthesis luciferase-like monooxygenase protein